MFLSLSTFKQWILQLVELDNIWNPGMDDSKW